jgi:uncharacterized repeat protein (TIGR03803 family)
VKHLQLKLYRAVFALVAILASSHAEAVTDLSFYTVQKAITYVQSSGSTPTLDPETPFQFYTQVQAGTTGSVLALSTLTPQGGGTVPVVYQAGANGLQFAEDFLTQSALDSTFPDGPYNFTIQTSTPNTYTDQLSLEDDNYPFLPAIPQITSISNGSWVGGHIEITNNTQPLIITWTTFASDTGGIFVNVNNTGFGQSVVADGTVNSIMIPASTFTNNTLYQASINFSNNTSVNDIPGTSGQSSFAVQVNFFIQEGTPTPPTTTLYAVTKSHVLLQTSNSAPANGAGNNDAFNPAPYRFKAQSAVGGSVVGPSGTASETFPMGFTTNNDSSGDNFEYDSGAVASQSSLDSTYPDGNYKLGDGNTASLTGDAYPNVPQITQVNGATPVWNAQGQLVLNPGIINTLTFTSFNITAGLFATNGNESVHLESADDGLVNIKQQSGITTTLTTSFNTLMIPANTLTTERTYVGRIQYLFGSSANSPSAGVLDVAAYSTETDFTVIAATATGLIQTINFPALGTNQVVGTSVSLVATASSGLPVAFNVTGPATLSGNTLTFTGVGTVNVDASQTGNVSQGGPYAAADTLIQVLQVSTTASGGIGQTITFPQIPEPQNEAIPYTLQATSTSGLPVTFSVASGPGTITGNILTYTGTGAITINADQAGNGSYAAAPEVQVSTGIIPPPDLNNFSIQKEIDYVQSSAAAPTLRPEGPYRFSSYVNSGSTAVVLSTSTLTPPSGTGTLNYEAGSGQSDIQQRFQTKTAMDTAYPDAGNYNLVFQTDTPNTYPETLVIGTENYPSVIPQLLSVSNATWIGGILVVTNINADVVFTWNTFTSSNGSIFFNYNNNGGSGTGQSFPANGTAASSTYTIPGGTLTNNTLYQGTLQFQNFINASTGLNGGIGFQTQIDFNLQVGTPTPPFATRYDVGKGHTLVQTSNSTPVNGSGDRDDFGSAPYALEIESPTAGSTTAPGSTVYPLSFDAEGGENDRGEYRYESGAIASQATMDTTYPDGTYTLADGHTVSLTGDTYPNIPQILSVNGATPIWNSQGQLILDPTVDNMITWTPFNISNALFATNGHIDAQFQSENDDSVDIETETGATEPSQTPFNTLDIPAGTMTAELTYDGSIDYFHATSISSPSTSVYDIAGYQTQTNFVVLAVPAPPPFTPTFNTAGDIGVTSNGYVAAGQTLALTLGFAPTGATTLTVINNTSSSPISGTFSNVPEGSTVSASFDGNTYTFVATYKGGDGNDMVLSYTPPIPPASLVILHNFGDGSVVNDGAQPACSLIQAPDGNFYGTTNAGGIAGNGTVFKMTPQGVITILHVFQDDSVINDGSSPNGLVRGTDGNFYGTTFFGGGNGLGAVFEITPQGQVTILHSFGDGSVPNDGTGPSDSMIQGSDGNFYGTTPNGGSGGAGVVFKISSQGQYTILHNFGDGSVPNDGHLSSGRIIQGSDGNFYGETQQGGTAGFGTVYKMTPQGVVTILHSFSDGTVNMDGAQPSGSLTQGPDSNFYGSTSDGGASSGASGFGTVYKITPQGQVTILHRFNDGSVPNDGQFPLSLILGQNGNYYGMTDVGGSSGLGTIFQITPQGVVTILHSFGDGSVLHDGLTPTDASLLQTSDGSLYGTTINGGVVGGFNGGTVFKFNPSLPVLTSALTTNGTVSLPFSYQPVATNAPTSYAATGLPAGLSIDANTGLITGTPTAPGTTTATLTFTNSKGPASAPLTFNIIALPSPTINSLLNAYGTEGTSFTYTVTGTNNTTSFTASTLPNGLTFSGTAGTITGTPLQSGTFPITLRATNATGPGATSILNLQIFASAPTAAEEYTILEEFGNSSPPIILYNPTVLIQGFDGTFYGLSGGADGTPTVGTVFNVTSQGNTSIFHTFGTSADGFSTSPQGLLQAADGNFYGTTYDGGTANLGTVFKISQDGTTVSVLHSFGDGSVVNDGAHPQGAGLTQGSDGNFYSTTESGGSKGLGTVYKITPLGAVTILHNFGDGTVTNDGSNPVAGLVQDSVDGNFYGVAQNGGSHSAGTIFKITPAGVMTVLHSFQDGTVTNDGANPLATLLLGSDGSFYGTTQNGGSTKTASPPGFGTVFKMTFAGVVSTLHSFGDNSVANDGANPVAPLIQGYDGNLYGMTYAGGSHHDGTAFEMTTTGTETLIHQFGDPTETNDGIFPNGPLLQGTDGNFYGTTSSNLNGSSSVGTVFSIVTSQVSNTIKPIFNGATSFSGAALSPISYTPKAAFGVSNTGSEGGGSRLGAGGGTAIPADTRAIIRPLFSSISDWSASPLPLPNYLTFDSVSGTITGTPAAAGTYMITMTPENSAGAGTSEVVTLFIDVAPVLTSPTTATSSVGASFVYPITANAAPTSFGATGLPGWLTVTTTSGIISGTPPGTGTYIFSPTASNVAGTGTEQVTLTVGTSAITSATTASVASGTAYTYQITASPTPTAYSAVSLPPGLLFNSMTGTITGMPTTVGTYQIPIGVTTSSGMSSAVLTLTVTPLVAPVITSCSYTNGMPNSTFGYQITGTNAPTSFQAAGLPTGLTINTSTGAITGTPSGVSDTIVTISATNSIGTGRATLEIAVVQSSLLPDVTNTPTSTTALQSFNYTIQTNATPTSYNATGLPSGLTINTGTGQITGTPTIPGTYYVTLSAVSAAGTGTAILPLTVAAPTFTQWETAHNIPANTNPSASSFPDGIPNLLKYLFAIDPTVPINSTSRDSLPAEGIAMANGSPYLTLSYVESALAGNLDVEVQTSSDLVNWSSYSLDDPTLYMQQTTDPSTGNTMMQVGVPITGSPHQFIRLNVTP